MSIYVFSQIHKLSEISRTQGNPVISVNIDFHDMQLLAHIWQLL